MKTLLLTLATAVMASLFSSCGCCNNSGTHTETKHYDYKGRLVKEVKPSGNYNTYHYDGTSPDYVAPSGPKSVAPTPSNNYVAPRASRPSFNGSWKPRLP